MKNLITILSSIQISNSQIGLMSLDESNERILSILSVFDLDDNEESLTDAFGVKGLHAIRAETLDLRISWNFESFNDGKKWLVGQVSFI